MYQNQGPQNEVVRLYTEYIVRFQQFFTVVIQTSHNNRCKYDLLNYLQLTCIFPLQRYYKIADCICLLHEKHQSWPVTQVQLYHSWTCNQTIPIFYQCQTHPSHFPAVLSLATLGHFVYIGKYCKSFIQIDVIMYNCPLFFLNAIIYNYFGYLLHFGKRKRPLQTFMIQSW